MQVWCELRCCWGQWRWLKMQLMWSLVHLLFCSLYLSAAEGYEAALTYRKCLCVAFAVFHPVTLMQLLSFNPLKPLVSHQNVSLLKCNPLTSVPLLCSSYVCVCESMASRVSACAKGWKNLNIKLPRWGVPTQLLTKAVFLNLESQDSNIPNIW